MKLAGKRVLITGASAGIGAASAKAFAQAGARVALAARRKAKLEAVLDVVKAEGGEGVVVACDVCDPASLEIAAKKVRAAFGGLDMALVNAGFGVTGPFQKLKPDDFRRQFETNFFGALNTIYAVLPDLLESQGHIGVVASVAAMATSPNTAPYNASKAALAVLAESMSFDLAPDGVTVTLINPGFIESDIRRTDNRGQVHENAPDPVPAWLVCPAEKAARQIVRAMARRKPELIITRHGKLFMAMARHFPRAHRALMRRAARRKRPRDPRGK